MQPITRRQALIEMVAGAAVLAGCGSGRSGWASGSGSTPASTWRDLAGVGSLTPGPGEPLLARTDLGPRRAPTRVLATLAHVTDAHVLDASSPARVTFLDRLGPPFQSTFRPQETLTTQVLAGAARAIRALRPDLVIQGGDLIDNDQSNELSHALSVLRGGIVHPGSGPGGYFGVQLAGDPDPFYYRPDLDAPRHPGLLRQAVRPFTSSGLGARWCPVLGDHDILVAGEIPPTGETRSLALGDRAVWELPPGLTPPAALTQSAELAAPGRSLGAGYSPDGPPAPELVDWLLARALAAPKVRVPADASRRELDVGEVVDRLRRASGIRSASGTLDYHLDLGEQLRLIVLDLARRGGGSGGLVRPGQPAWLASQLATAGDRWVIVASHQPLESAEGGEQLLALLDGHDRVIAALSGHTHRNQITTRSVTGRGGYWLINTASLIDYPQQARALRIVETQGGGVALQTWMLDHVASGTGLGHGPSGLGLGQISRELAYLDAQGGRPQGSAGGRLDRNVMLFLR
jgi:3',5'-cyclic AMP phosphodiesterase CpdA